jgi:drug/metabolite transporter (DMT)-like permease
MLAFQTISQEQKGNLSREDWICIALMIIGIFLFLYGANYYNNGAGWSGVLLFAIGLFGLIALAVYNALTKRSSKPETSSEAKMSQS